MKLRINKYRKAEALLFGLILVPVFAMKIHAQGITLNLPEPVQSVTASGSSMPTSMSPAGPTVTFVSDADDLVSNDHNDNQLDVFVRNMETGVTTLVSVNAAGTNSGNGPSNYALISKDGRFVVFESKASDLVENDLNHTSDIFLRDLTTESTKLISNVPVGGISELAEVELIGMSNDAAFVAFQKRDTDLSFAKTDWRLYLYDRAEGAIRPINANSNSENETGLFCGTTTLSADGSRLAFVSPAPDLAGDALPEGLSLGFPFLYVYDIASSKLERIDPSEYGLEISGIDPATYRIPFLTLSDNGKILVITQQSGSNRVRTDVVYDVTENSHATIDSELLPPGTSHLVPPAMSSDGSVIAIFPYSLPYGRLFLWESGMELMEITEYPQSIDSLFVRNVALNSEGDRLLLDHMIFNKTPQGWVSATPAIPQTLIESDAPQNPGIIIDSALSVAAFYSQSSELGFEDTNNANDAFLYDLENQTARLISQRHPEDSTTFYNGLQISWENATVNDAVHYKNDLSRETWTNLPGDIVTDETSGSIRDTSANLFPHRFYQVIQNEVAEQ